MRSRGAPGQTYAFRGAAVDRFGNATAPKLADRAVVPFDQLQPATYTGSVSTAAREGAYGGTVTFLRTAGTTVTLRSAGDRLQLIGERCPTCGELDVFLDGRRQARVDTGSPVRAVRQVLWSSPVQYTNKVRTMTVRAVGTPGRPGVVVDAFAARRFGPDAATSPNALSAPVVTGPKTLLAGDTGTYNGYVWTTDRRPATAASVTLQYLRGSTWVDLPELVATTATGRFTLTRVFGVRGTIRLRVLAASFAGSAASGGFTLRVT